MTMRYIPGAAAISEFVAGYHGDCGETAELAALHTINPAAYPLDAAALSALVKRDISKGWASTNGSEPISAIANDCGVLGVAHTNYGYAEPFNVDWRGELASFGGIKPIIFEYARAGALPGDESGVQYHFNTCLAWDSVTASGLFADGDNIVERNGGTALVAYTEAELAAAGLCGMLTLDYLIGGASMAGVPAGWSDDGTTLRAPNGVPVIGAIRAFVLGNAWDANDTPMAPEQTVSQVELANAAIGGGARQFFKESGQVSWNATFNHGAAWRTWAGQELFAYYNQLVKDAQAIQQLQNTPPPAPAPTPAPAPAPAPDPAIAAKATALDDLMALYGLKG